MRFLKVGGVIFGAVVITALGIDAADTLQGSRSTLLGQLAGSAAGGCPAGMIEISAATTFSCVDMYEASPNKDCEVQNPKNEFDTKRNLDAAACGAVSVEATSPWRQIDRASAQLACVRSGKRLPTNEEWYLFAMGTPDNEQCNIGSNTTGETGLMAACVSAVGVYDAIGNVWEWTADDVIDGVYNGRLLPAEGYVARVDSGGVATVSTSTVTESLSQDYLWTKPAGAYGIMRGGFYGSDSDAGVHAVHAATLPTMKGAAIGFRCVQ